VHYLNDDIFRKDIVENGVFLKEKDVKQKNESFVNNNLSNNFKKFEFKANPKEYFKIWIVNVALSLITLGIYSAWAKVRTNRYFYASTYLNGSNFEYNANPKRILIGRLIIFSFYALFLLFMDYLYMPQIGLGIMVLFLLLMPWLIRQAIRFKLKVTSYRNISFSYKGKIRSFYILAIAFILTFAIIFAVFGFFATYFKGSGMFFVFFILAYVVFPFVVIPIFYRKYKALVINNSYYGSAKFSFNASKRETMWLFLKIFIATLIGAAIIGALFGLGGTMLSKYFQNNKLIASIALSIFYLILIGFYKGVADGYFANYIRNNTTLQNAPFKGEIEPISLGLINAKNYIFMIFTLGLYYPWAKIAYLRHKIENSYFACDNYDKFLAGAKDQTNTIGEEAMDFFDIDVGL
jgi:uncharacterized membrane protein YjgN (DUF898 family)